MRGALPLALVLAGCNVAGGADTTPTATDFVGTEAEITPGLASCAATIGRPDLAIDPDGPMSNAEIEALLACTAERARG